MGIKDEKIQTIGIDPLGSRLSEAGFEGGVGKLNKLKFRKQEKIIQKIPNKNFKSETTSGKEQKKLAIKQQKNIADKMTRKGDEYSGPIKAYKSGGRVNLRGGGCAKRGVKKNAYGKNS